MMKVEESKDLFKGVDECSNKRRGCSFRRAWSLFIGYDEM